MKFKNIVVGFLKIWLLATLFYSGLLYAERYMFITLQDYSHTADEFRPYTFIEDPNTGNVVKVFDTENNFQFKTYSLDSEADMALFRTEVQPTLLEWSETIRPFQYRSALASRLSKSMLENVNKDLLKGSLSKEIHVTTYKGNIEGVSYTTNAEVERPEIDTLIANPKGLTTGQTTYPKGGGSALLDYELRQFKENGVEKVRLYSLDDDYYRGRGWQNEPKSESGFDPDLDPEFDSDYEFDVGHDFDYEHDFDFDFEPEGACGGQ
ncbi:hypothetical protein BTHERMOSOX_833 [Bathymodiolus thermophilus thioautotrophic gill symbiont]|uniref:Uncharacterized protein n=3 Tax=Bathymodiolus thermophilus thioautotrophic gill symbiont TaxID=2360 RepID=A0A3G3IKG7_9GAMM|nr:hypothetical protein [Bathymodiolus thermophilus thioautotrophic gill symbiont]AYQ56074.1 hypothetical protein MS2017_0328 [Bathymodiolus thermophilus thioautotrophic gill symbiont]CAB5500753.1 hypothetical protein THERMOS_1264 [Bathymodiolus thermophilus thioautotrophic gill symbiont]CAB5505371.1 hypothetical protein THERMOT_2142 [Bathymodiolus thermophilus thioautotrophic gill symbiont]SGZ70983.1 hypothetical protein BTHERMOSOX_833 [Bathymodiolus thermophilus thioautotrophic gill symbiont]